MKTRRTRTKRSTRGSGKWFTQPLRRWGIYDAGPSTSKLSNYIYTLFKSPISKEEKVLHLREILNSNKSVKHKKLIRDLEDRGIEKYSDDMREIEAELQYTLPRRDRREHT
jgi:hypothetical protein